MQHLLEQEDSGPPTMIRGNLSIRHLTRDDFAMYTCRGDTVAGRGEQNFRLGPGGPIVLDERKMSEMHALHVQQCIKIIIMIITVILQMQVKYYTMRHMR